MHCHRLLTAVIGAALFFCASGEIAAQEPAPLVLDTSAWVAVQTTDGNEFIGKFLSQNAEVLVLQTENFGALTIRKQAVRSIRLTTPQKIVNGRVWFENPFAGRYFASTSGYGLRKGEGAVDNGWAIFNQVTYGFSDHFSLGAGIAPLIVVDGPFPIWVNPKFSIPLKKDQINLAIGGLYGRSFSDYEFDNMTFGAVYSQITLGPRDANLSAGLGFTISDGVWSRNPVFSLSGVVRTGPRFALIGESYFFPSEGDNVTLLAVGGRFMGRRVAFDLALVAPVLEDDGVYPVPWLGLHVPFGSPKK